MGGHAPRWVAVAILQGHPGGRHHVWLTLPLPRSCDNQKCLPTLHPIFEMPVWPSQEDHTIGLTGDFCWKMSYLVAVKPADYEPRAQLGPRPDFV